VCSLRSGADLTTLATSPPDHTVRTPCRLCIGVGVQPPLGHRGLALDADPLLTLIACRPLLHGPGLQSLPSEWPSRIGPASTAIGFGWPRTAAAGGRPQAGLEMGREESHRACDLCRVKTSPRSRVPHRCLPLHLLGAGRQSRSGSRSRGTRGYARRSCWQIAGIHGQPLTLTCRPIPHHLTRSSAALLGTTSALLKRCGTKCPVLGEVACGISAADSSQRTAEPHRMSV
jgi:hypothetical protein